MVGLVKSGHYGGDAASSVKAPIDEATLWKQLEHDQWHSSINRGGVFFNLYRETCKVVEELIKLGKHDVILDVGCGTGDIIGRVRSELPRVGVDFNHDFVAYCQEQFKDCTFEVLNAEHLVSWWKSHVDYKDFKRPLVICCNNTLSIMPEAIRSKVVQAMMEVAGDDGQCLLSYWSGQFFSYGLMAYYRQNQQLCGSFEVNDEYVNWDERKLVTDSGYSTQWPLPEHVKRTIQSYGIPASIVDNISDDKNGIFMRDIGIMVRFQGKAANSSKAYYDSEDAQNFYSSIWGTHTVHIGRYDQLSMEMRKRPLTDQIVAAQEIHEQNLTDKIRSLFGFPRTSSAPIVPLRILDMGCGYGGLLRKFHEEGFLWNGVGVDISAKMCEKTAELNRECGAPKGVLKVNVESYLDVSVPDESQDLVVSMDAFLHVGPELHAEVLKEAYRVLRPGGWLVFTDILERENVDPVVLKPIYERIHLTRLGTPENYARLAEEAGFGRFQFEDHSSNIRTHYESVRQVLVEKYNDPKEYLNLSEGFYRRMEAGLVSWRELSGDNMQWGMITMQKLKMK